MTLQHPTTAQRVYDEFRTRKWRGSLSDLAETRGADVERKWGCIEYTFDDDSVIRTKGRGRNHRVEVLLP